MFRKSLMCAAIGTALAGGAAQAQDATTVAELQKQLAELKAKIEQMEARQTEMRTAMKETNEAVAEQGKKVDKTDGKLSLGKGINNLKLTGDLRVRYEQRDRDLVEKNGVANAPDDGDRSRFRTRFRLGFVWNNKTEQWEVGAGLATGGADGRSTNDTWGERNGSVFETDEIRLDYAYAKHKWLWCDTPVSLTAGQQKNPFVVTGLNWDGDLRPVGFTAQYGDPFGKGYSGPFATAGGYLVQWQANGRTINGSPQTGWDDNVNLYALQLGWAQKGENMNWLAAAGYQHVSSAFRNEDGWLVADMANSQNPNATFGTGNNDYAYDVLDVYAELKTAMAGFDVKPYVHAAYNMGADGAGTQARDLAANSITPDDENLGWLLGLDIKHGKWGFGYYYAQIGADCVFGPMRDSDFGETAGLRDTDIKGHAFRLGYNITKNLNVGAAYLMLERINSDDVNDASPEEARLVQVDAVWKF